MLKKISLKNFKGFQTLDNLEFKPITILCGTNSSGKSSILKSLLLMQQTMNGQQLASSLLLNGKLVKLGTFENIIYNHDANNEITISLSFNFENSQKVLKRTRIKSMIRDFFNIDINKNPNFNISFSFSFKKNLDNICLSYLNIEGNDVFFELTHKENSKYILKYKNLFECEKKNNCKNNGNMEVEAVFNNPLFPNIIIPLLNKDLAQKEDFLIRRHIDMMCHYSNVVLDYLLDQINYIGPLRKEPARRYIYEDEVLSIGNKGENTAYIYAKEKNNKINAYFYNEPKNTFDYDSVKLSTALNRWLKIMNIIDFDNNQRNEIIRLNVKSNSGVKVDISDVGFGVSQILPILVEGLRMDEGQTLLLEQPEIHLHPKLQMQLTDFFIAMAKNNKNTIIETHSEHIINRLVRRCLEDDEIRKMINIYFIDENSNIELIKINKKIGIENWPKNFFDQAANEQKEILKLTCKNMIGT